MWKKWLFAGFIVVCLALGVFLFFLNAPNRFISRYQNRFIHSARRVDLAHQAKSKAKAEEALSPPLDPRVQQSPHMRHMADLSGKADEKLPAFSAPKAATGDQASINASALDSESVEKIRYETKVLVASIYGAQRQFFLKHGRYTTDLIATGWSPDVRFNNERVGFLTPYFPRKLLEGENPKFMSTDDFLRLEEHERGSKGEYSKSAQGISLEKLRKYCQAGCTASEKHFEVIGAMNLDADSDLDIWLINDKKQIVQLVDDLKE